MTNLPIDPGAVMPNQLINLYGGDGYFFCYDDLEEGAAYKIHRYNTDGTPNWQAPINANNRDIGLATYTKYAFIDTYGNLIHVSSYNNTGLINYCINKISPSGLQLFNGSDGISVNGFVIGANLSSSQSLFLACDDLTMRKYDSDGNLVWSSIFANAIPIDSYASNVEIAENSDGTVGVVFLQSIPGVTGYGYYYYSILDVDGTLLSTVQLETDICKLWDTRKLIKNSNELYFLFCTQNDESYIQKIVSNNVVLAGNGLKIDNSINQLSIYKSALVKNNQLHVLYEISGYLNGPVGIASQIVDLSTFDLLFPNGNILFDYQTNNVSIVENGLIDHGEELGFVVLDHLTNNIKYIVYDGNAVTLSADVCITNTIKNNASLSTLIPLTTNTSQVCVLFDDERTNEFGNLYAQNIIFPMQLNVDTKYKDDIAIVVFPNPSSHYVQIQSALPVSFVNIIGMGGESLYSNAYSGKIDISNLPDGLYIMKIVLMNNEIYYKKFQIMND